MFKNRDGLRLRIYMVAFALGAWLLAKQLITKEDLDLYLVVIEALFGVLIIPNTPKTSRDVPEIHNVDE